MLPSHPVLRCGCAGLVRQDHPVGVPRILGGRKPGSSAERTAHSGTGWMHRGTDSPVSAGGEKMNERYDIQKDGVVR